MKRKRVTIDDLALVLRKPQAGPLVEPAEAISIALAMTVPMNTPLSRLSPEGAIVRNVLLAIKLAGYKIEPR